MAGIAASLLLTGCGKMTGIGDAGCAAYAEARMDMPRGEALTGQWGAWVADTDDRMTGTCR